MNLSSLREQTAKFCGDPNRTRYVDADILIALNRAQEQFTMETRALWKDKSWTHAASDADEDLPTDFMWEDWVTYDGLKLTPITRARLNSVKGDDWTDDTASLPTHYIIDPEEAVKEIVLYPIPTDAKTLLMRYFPLPTALAADADTPLNSSALMAQFHIGLSAYAAWLLLAAEEVTPSVAAKRNDMLGIYSDARDKATEMFKNTVSAGWRLRGTRPV